MLFYRHRIVGAAFDGRVVGNDDAVLAFDDADSGHHSGRWRIVAIHLEGGKRGEFEKIRTGVDQAFDALARRELFAPTMLFDGFARRRRREPRRAARADPRLTAPSVAAFVRNPRNAGRDAIRALPSPRPFGAWRLEPG